MNARALRKSHHIVARPETATYELMGEGRDFGHAYCPICDEKSHVLGPKGKEWGFAWAKPGCDHCKGCLAGHGLELVLVFE